MPFGLTVGLGTSWEFYASYPNILFNNQEDLSGKGRAELGTKYRFYGKSNSKIKLAADLFGQRTISADTSRDSLSNFGGRVISSIITDPVGFHLYTGYLFAGSPPGRKYDNEVLYGAGLDFSPTSRSKLTFEVTGNTNPDTNLENPMEGTVGLQYYLTPHLTLNLAGGFGFSAASPDWRGIVGITTCQGIGTYIKPIPRVLRPGEKKEVEVVKPVKIFPITPLLIGSAAPPAPVSKLDVQVESDQEEVYVRPSAQVIIPSQPSTNSVTMPPLGTLRPSGEKTGNTALVEKPNENPHEAVSPAPAEPVAEEVLGDGETPLYSIDVKGDKLSMGAAKPQKKQEKMIAYRKYRFPDVVYEYNQTELNPDLKKSLSEVADLLRNDKKWSYIRIDAHTDSIGSSNYNMDLSLKRAITIATYLTINEGVDPSRVFIKGMGKTKLISDNATTAGRKVNRRFEILLLAPKEKL